MHYLKVTILHQPDAGQHSSRHFSYQELLGHTDLATAREFAFKALAEGNFQKGFVKVVFPQAADYAFQFERTGLIGYNLTQTQVQPEEVQFV